MNFDIKFHINRNQTISIFVGHLNVSLFSLSSCLSEFPDKFPLQYLNKTHVNNLKSKLTSIERVMFIARVFTCAPLEINN